MNQISDETLRSLGLENAQRLALIQSVDVPRYGSSDLNIPALKGRDLNKTTVLAANGKIQGIAATSNPERFTVKFKGVNLSAKTDLYVFCRDETAVSRPVEAPSVPVAAEPLRVQVKPKGVVASTLKRIGDPVVKALQSKQSRRLSLKSQEIAYIRGKDPSIPGLKNKRVLTFDHCGSWPRALGMIQKATQLSYDLGVDLHRFYDRMSGQGDGAIIAAAFAAGISSNDLAKWWTSEWRDVHTPGFLQKSKRWMVSRIKANETGFDAKKARKAIQKLFTDPNSGAFLNMGDVRTELYISVMQADLNMSLHRSDKHQPLPLWSACEDTAVTKMDYNQKQTIKGEAVFLGAVEKNDVLGMIISPDNEGLEITSIGTPVRVSPDGGRKLHKLDSEADKVALKASNHFVYDKRVDQAMKKLVEEAGLKIRYLRLECAPIDDVVANSTTRDAMHAGINSGNGTIALPEWFKAGFSLQLAN